ncbi:hypothetical protein Bbelb_314060 [Branchiostoma belcheri]|nr:hypothetical protein Bbelb_314060 [Branchiostoma belcheri]
MALDRTDWRNHIRGARGTSSRGWVETDPTWVTPDDWESADGVRHLAGYVLDGNMRTGWKRAAEEDTWRLTFDLQTPVTLSRIQMWYYHTRDVTVLCSTSLVKRFETVKQAPAPQHSGAVTDGEIHMSEVDLSGFLATGQFWRMQFSSIFLKPFEIMEVKFFQACSGLEKTVCSDGDCDVYDVMCDGIVDCVDGSDEENCEDGETQLLNGQGRYSLSATLHVGSGERKDKMACNDGQCRELRKECKADSRVSCGHLTHLYSRCDGTEDCSDGSDEYCLPVACDNGALFHPATRCNLKDDCGDNSDEKNCDCYYLSDKGTSYRGRADRDRSCQFWTSQYPHAHNHTPEAYPSAGLELNYCRNPDGKDRPWCYTNNPLVRWRYCDDVFACDALPTRCFYAVDKGRSYAGHVNRAGDRLCQRWDSQSPHTHPHTPQAHPDAGLEENFCRNPDNKERPWCYTTDPALRWDYCNVMECADSCRHFSTTGRSSGSSNKTIALQNCSEPALIFASEEFLVLSNGSVYLLSSNVSCPAEQVAISNATASICGECILQYFSNDTRGGQTVNSWEANQGWLTLGLVIVSTVAVIVFVVHTVRSGQWKKVPEKLKVQVTTCMTAAEVMFVLRVLVPSGPGCTAYAILLHYLLLTAFTSMNALSMDLFLTFRDDLDRAKLHKYVLYTWLAPMIVVVATVIVEFGSSVRVGYGENCWIGNPTASLVAFGVPVFCALVVNAVLVTFALVAIRKSFQIANRAMSRSQSSKAWVYLRISFLMGLTWILGFIYPYVNSRVVEYIFVVLNASQGLLLTVVMTMTGEVLEKWKSAIMARFGMVDPHQNNGATVGKQETNTRGTEATAAQMPMMTDGKKNRARLHASRQDNEAAAGIRQTSEPSAVGTGSDTEIPMTCFTDEEETKVSLCLAQAHQDNKAVATVGNRQTTVGGTEVGADGTGSATEIPMAPLNDEKETKENLHLAEPRQDNKAATTVGNWQITVGGTEVRADGTGSATEIPMAPLSDEKETKESLHLAEPRQDNKVAATVGERQTTAGGSEAKAAGTGPNTEIPMVTLTDDEENKASLHVAEPYQVKEAIATVGNRQTSAGGSGEHAARTGSATETPLNDVENKASLHLAESRQDNETTATASSRQTTVGGTEANPASMLTEEEENSPGGDGNETRF